MGSPLHSAAGRKRRVIVGTFVHNYRWGAQIRGDERGYVEKVKRYKVHGFEFYTVEKRPSIQDGMKEDLYTSEFIGDCAIPPSDISQLGILSLWGLKAAFKRYPSRPFAIYAYNQDVENLWLGYLLKVLIGAPLVVVYHQIRPASFVSFKRGVVDRVRKGFHPIRAVTKSLLPAMNRFAAEHADVHIALSDATRTDVENYLGIKECKVIGNGLDTDKFRALNLPRTIDAVFLGRLAPQKGIDILLEAWSEVVRGDPGLRLVLIGGGETKDVSRYRGMVKELSLEKNVDFAGFVGDDELVRLLNSSKLFVFPSRQEGFAQAVSQAMGCGLCCILSDIPPLREVYGGAAVFSPLDQPKLLAETIRRLLGAEEERRLFSERARQLAGKFSWEAAVKQEISLIMASTGAD